MEKQILKKSILTLLKGLNNVEIKLSLDSSKEQISNSKHIINKTL